MNRIHERRRDIDSALGTLKTLDAADSNVDPTSVRARADLARILGTDPLHEPRRLAARGAPTQKTRRTARKVALVGGVLAAVSVGLVVLPSLTGGDEAFATWTSAPDAMTAQERTDAVASCREAEGDGAGTEYVDELSNAEPVIAERRGVWNTVILADSEGFSALCITDVSTHLFTKDMIGSIGTPTGYTPARPRELVATDLGTGTMSAGDISLAAGTAGTTVVGVVFHSRDHGDVAATVSHGHFALWFPGDELRDANSTNGVRVEVTYRDGSTGTSVLKSSSVACR